MFKVFTVFLLFGLIYGVRLTDPPRTYFDEDAYVITANSFSHLNGFFDISHPPLGKLLMVPFIRMWGSVPLAWRLPSLICAAAATALSGYLAFQLTGNVRLFWLVSLLLSCDGLWITQARIGLVNAPMVVFIMAALVCWWHARMDPLNRIRFWVLSGICAGFATACKWQGALVILIPIIFQILSPSGKISKVKIFWAYLLLVMASAAAYFSTFLYVPFFKHGDWHQIFLLQSFILHFHFMHLYVPNPSAWYTWPFLLQPVWYEPPSILVHHMDLTALPVIGILCLGNPFIFMLIVPAFVWMAVCFKRDRSPVSIITLAGFFVFWLPSGMMGHYRFTMFPHFYPVMPFVVIAVAAMIDQMWQSQQNSLKMTAVFFIALVLLGCAFFFPLWTGLPVSYTYFNQHMWLHSWLSV